MVQLLRYFIYYSNTAAAVYMELFTRIDTINARDTFCRADCQCMIYDKKKSRRNLLAHRLTFIFFRSHVSRRVLAVTL